MTSPEERPSHALDAGASRLRPNLPSGHPSAHSAHFAVIRDLLADGEIVQAGESLSVGSEALTREFRNYNFSIADSRNRLPSPRSVPPTFSLLTAVARFVWLMSGSSRLESIRFYSQGVANFSDDGFVVPGSSYGERLFYARPGLDQISNAINILKEDGASRRAVVTVYLPDDTARASKDIPCTYGLAFHIRQGALHTTTVMRSNNAWTLLPYNVFEFTLLAEVVAARVGVPLGSYSHSCLSLHVYDRDFAPAETWLDDATHEDWATPMSPIDDVAAFTEVKALLEFEERVRANFAAADFNLVQSQVREAMQFGPVWSDFALMLVILAARRARRVDLADQILPRVSEPLRAYIPRVGAEQPELPLG